MRIKQQVKADLRIAKKIRVPWRWLFVIGVGSLILDLLFDHFGRLDLALPTFNSIAVFAFAIIVKRDLGRRAWFWGAMAVLGALHVLAIIYIPWGDKWVPALAIAAIDSADLVFIFAILDAIGAYINRFNPSRHNRLRTRGPDARAAAPPPPSRGSRAARRP